MRLILLGAPGAGKGTQAQYICQEFAIPQISTGDMLRSAVSRASSLGVEAKRYMEAGELVPDDLIIELVKQRIQEADCREGYLLDGFPRTMQQAKALNEAGVNIDFVIELEVPFDDIVRRISGRRVHPSSGRSYHIEFNPPRTEMIDDETGEELVQRVDDQEATVRNRLSVYRSQTQPLVEYYEEWASFGLVGGHRAPRFHRVSGSGSIAEIKAKISHALLSKADAH